MLDPKLAEIYGTRATLRMIIRLTKDPYFCKTAQMTPQPTGFLDPLVHRLFGLLPGGQQSIVSGLAQAIMGSYARRWLTRSADLLGARPDLPMTSVAAGLGSAADAAQQALRGMSTVA